MEALMGSRYRILQGVLCVDGTLECQRCTSAQPRHRERNPSLRREPAKTTTRTDGPFLGISGAVIPTRATVPTHSPAPQVFGSNEFFWDESDGMTDSLAERGSGRLEARPERTTSSGMRRYRRHDQSHEVVPAPHHSGDGLT